MDRRCFLCLAQHLQSADHLGVLEHDGRHLQQTQAKRLFGFIAAGGTVGTIAAPAFTVLFVKTVGTNTLLLISAVGFVITALLVRLLVENAKRTLRARRPGGAANQPG